MTMLAFGAFTSIFLSWLLSGWLRRYALFSRHLIDLPNERCSHSVPPPLGGGVAIVASFLLLILGVGLAGALEPRLCIAICGSGLLAATLGFMDHRSSFPARWRFLGHAAAAAWVLWWMDHISQVPVFGTLIDLSYAGPVLCGRTWCGR